MCAESQIPGSTGAVVQPLPLETVRCKEIPGRLGLYETVVAVEYSLPAVVSCQMVFSEVLLPLFFYKAPRSNITGNARDGNHVDALNEANIMSKICGMVHFVLEELWKIKHRDRISSLK